MRRKRDPRLRAAALLMAVMMIFTLPAEASCAGPAKAGGIAAETVTAEETVTAADEETEGTQAEETEKETERDEEPEDSGNAGTAEAGDADDGTPEKDRNGEASEKEKDDGAPEKGGGKAGNDAGQPDAGRESTADAGAQDDDRTGSGNDTAAPGAGAVPEMITSEAAAQTEAPAAETQASRRETAGEDPSAQPEENAETQAPETAQPEEGQTSPAETAGEDLLQPSEETMPEIPAVPAELETGSLPAMLAEVPPSDYTTNVIIDKVQWVGFGSLGDGSTMEFRIRFTDKSGRTIDEAGYCAEPHWPAPDGTFPQCGVTELKDSKKLAKVVYYGTESMSGDDCFFKQSGNTGYTDKEQYGIIHWAAAKTYGSEDWSYCSNAAGRAAVSALISYADSMPAIPDAEISFSKTEVKASVPSGADYQKTPEIKFKADEGNSITVKLPKFVTYHNADDGTSSAESNGSTEVTIEAGTSFYFTAPLEHTDDMDDSWTVDAKGKYTKDIQAYLLDAGMESTYDHYQPVICVQGFTGDRKASFKVTWIRTASLTVTKAVSAASPAYAEMVSGNSLYSLKDSEFGVYAAENDASADRDRILTLKCGEDGKTPETELDAAYIGKTIYVRETKAGKGYQLNQKIFHLKASVGANEITIENVPLWAQVQAEKLDASTAAGEPQGQLDPSGIRFRLDYYKAALGSLQEAGAASEAASWTVRALPETVSGRTRYIAKLDAAHKVSGTAVYEINGTYAVPLGTLTVTELAGTSADYGTDNMYWKHAGGTVSGTGMLANIEEQVNADGTKTVKITAAGKTVTGSVFAAEAYDYPMFGDLEIEKYIKGKDIRLAGAVFRLHRDGQVVKPDAQNRITGDIDADGRITVKADGTASVRHIPTGTYELEEVYSPVGYKARSDRGTVVISCGSQERREENDLLYVPVSVQKIDAETGKSTPQGNARFAGAVFEIIADEAINNQFDIDLKKGDTAAVLTLNAAGFAKTAGNVLTEGHYVLHEKVPPEGYLAMADIPFVITKNDDGKTITFDYPNAPCRGGVKVGKINRETGSADSLGAAKLSGAKFDIINRSDAAVMVDRDGDAVYETEVAPGGIVFTIVTGSDGIAQTDAHALPYGHYELTETEPPEGYLSPAEYHSLTYTREFDITEDGKMADLTGGGKAVAEQEIRNDLSFRKVGADDQSGMAFIPFRITSLTTGENHIVMTDRNGRYSSAKVKHSVKTNAGDDKNGDPEAGLWFGRKPDGTMVPVDDSLGALPYDKYRIEELPCEANAGMEMWEDEFEIFEDRHYQGGVIVDLYNIENERQPVIGTSASAASGIRYAFAQGTVLLTDTVSYSRLKEGTEYLLRTKLYNKTAGEYVKDSEGNDLTAERTFTANTKFGTVKTSIRVEAEDLAGADVVFFEEVYPADRPDGEPEAEHKDPDDEDQTIHFVKIRTSAAGKETGTNLINAAKDAEIIDTVSYENLEPGGRYTLTGTLMDKETGEEVIAGGNPVRATHTFTAQDAAGAVPVRFRFDASALAGKELVVFETLAAGGTILAEHADIEDEAQTISVPKIETNACDAETEEQTAIFREEMQIADRVTFSGLTPGKEYTFSGVLMDHDTGMAVTDDMGEPVTAKTKYTPEEPDGSVVLTFTLRNVTLTGKRIAAFEEVRYQDAPVAVHADLEDGNQTVWFPQIRTSAADAGNGTHTLSEGEKAVVTDTVTYDHLKPGEKYVIEGVLMDKDTGEPVTEDGEPVAVRRRFTAKEESGTVTLKFEFTLAGRQTSGFVVFETLMTDGAEDGTPEGGETGGADAGNTDGQTETGETGGGTVVAVHADITDPAQTVLIPTLRTEAKDAGTGLSIGSTVQRTVTVTDLVTYAGLEPGREYVMQGTLMKKADASPLLLADGTPVTAEKKFTPETPAGTVTMEFTFPAEIIRGGSAVVFEKLFCDGTLIGTHEDPEDEAQTVAYPSVATLAVDKKTGSRNMLAEKEAAVTDTVSYENLVPGMTYTVVGRLMDADSGEPLAVNGHAVTAKTEFTPAESSGTVTVEFSLDAETLAGKTLVAFEELYAGETKLAAHEDIEDQAQSVYVPEIRTNAKDQASGTRKGKYAESLTVTDTVTYKNLIPGEKYTVSGSLVYKKNGQPVLHADRKPVTADTSFTADASFGEIELAFTVKGSELEDTEVVVFEELLLNGLPVAVHADLNDERQTVLWQKEKVLPAKETTAEAPETTAAETQTTAVPAEETTKQETTAETTETTAAKKRKTGGGGDGGRTTPKTGDEQNVFFWLLLMLAAAGGTAAAAAAAGRRRKREKH